MSEKRCLTWEQQNQIYLQKGGGAAHFLFEITETDEWGVVVVDDDVNDGKGRLGTLEICWLRSTGEPEDFKRNRF